MGQGVILDGEIKSEYVNMVDTLEEKIIKLQSSPAHTINLHIK